MYTVWSKKPTGNRVLLSANNLFDAVKCATEMQQGVYNWRYSVRDANNKIVLECTPIKKV